MSEKNILVVDDEMNMRRILSDFLRRDGFEVTEASNGQEAIDCLSQKSFQLLVTDQTMPGIDGLALLAHCVKQYPRIPVVLITAHGTVETAVKAMKEGAFDYISKPFEEAELLNVIRKGIDSNNRKEKEPLESGEFLEKYGIVGKTSAMKDLFRLIEKVADTPSTVLVIGETGTGKELIARALHTRSSRKNKPFIAVNCGAIPENLVESELFGYEKGAFTGAVTSKPGRFELADGGTLFLDEVGEIKKEIQVKLLRFIQEQTFDRVGGVKTIHTDIRLIAATNRDLSLEIKEERFRQDLYYRLNVVTLLVPSLRDRMEDIPDLVYYFLNRSSRKLGRKVRSVTEEAMSALLTHDYPGNIRELENMIERAVLLTDGETLGIMDLPTGLREHGVKKIVTDLKSASREAATLAEKGMIIQTLSETGGNVTRAAEKLGMSRRGLQLKMKEYSLRGD